MASASETVFVLIETKSVSSISVVALCAWQKLTFETSNLPEYFLPEMLLYQVSSSLYLCN